MGPDNGERWQAADSAGSALVLLAASALWVAVSLVTGLFSVAMLLTRPGGPADTSDEL